MIFQEPMSSLSPLHRIGQQIGEVLTLHEKVSRREARERSIELLEQVGIRDPHRAVDRYPFEYSGGMRQRAMIAMALACNPSVLIADEPTTALDVSVQAEILELIRKLQQERGTAVLFITHDMGVVARDRRPHRRHALWLAGRGGRRPDGVRAPRSTPIPRPARRGPPVSTARRAAVSMRAACARSASRSCVARDLTKSFGEQMAVDKVTTRPARGREPRHRRRERLGQDHHGPLPAASLPDLGRAGRLSSPATAAARPVAHVRPPAARAVEGDPHRLPGPVQLAQPAHDRRPDPGRAAARA